MRNRMKRIFSFLFCVLTIVACQSDEKPEEAGTLPDTPQPEETSCKAWTDFLARNEQNVLLDFSYAGYEHGEVAPPDVSTLGYKVYDVTDYGAIPDDGKSDRAAFKKILNEIGVTHHPDARAIIYFPKGEFILFDEEDKAKGDSERLQIRAGSIILKGAGRDQTTITMAAPYPPLPNVEWAGPMIEFVHWSGFSPELSDIAGNASKGSFTIQVSSPGGIKAGDRVCLKLEDNSPELIAQELYPYQWMPSMTQLQNEGVQVFDIHQVKSVHGNEITFVEPIMHEVDKRWKWKLCRYNCYENIGIEDITFKGNAPADFVHSHWYINSAYKPIAFERIANSWIRRVNFHSVSESIPLTLCANVSAYDIHIGGNRGHCAIHAAGSARVLIANVIDEGESTAMKNAGQWHAVGVNKQCIGTVIKDCVWGDDTNFESHATQPRASLFDCCTGGFIQSHQGGDTSQLPNHLDDLTLWNFCATRVLPDEAANWIWWSEERGWKFLPPTIVGFHGAEVRFDASQVKLNQNQGEIVSPKSLYEAQLKQRLGYLPDIDYLHQ